MPWPVRRRFSGATSAGLALLPGLRPSTESAAPRKASRQPVTARGISAKIVRLTNRELRNETELQRTVMDLAQLLRWKRAHFGAGRMADGSWRTPIQGDAKGFPDLVLVRGKRLIVAELKGPTGKVEPEQQAWLDAFRHVAEVHVWRPSDIREIAVILAA